MRLFRYACAGLASSVLAASAFTAPASAQTAGLGTSLASTKALTAQLGEGGSLLDLSLLVDEARSTIDSAVAEPGAFTRLTSLAAKSSAVPTSPIDITQGVYEAKSTGPSDVPITGSTLAVPSAVPAELATVVSGALDPGRLTATLTDGVAAATMAAKLSSLKAVGGLVSLTSLGSTLDAASAAASSGATRGASATDLTVLDLGALLQGLGLPLAELTPGTLVALVDALGAQTGLPLPAGAATLTAAITQLNALLAQVTASVTLVGGVVTEVTSVVDTTVAGVLGTVGVTSPLPTATGTTQQVLDAAQAVIDELQGLINDLLSGGLVALDNLALLRLEGLDIGVVTKAAETVAGSTASVTGKIGKIFVGGVELPGIDLAGTAAQVSTAVAGVNTRLGEVLGLVDPGLADLVKVSVLDQATSITQSDGYTRSRAGVTAASASITPPAGLAGIVGGLVGQLGVGEVLGAAGAAVPAVDGLMGALAGTLDLVTGVLTSPAKVQVASVVSASDFRIAPVTTGGPVAPEGGPPTLPRTGGPDLVLFGGFLAVLALGLRRLTRTPRVQPVRIDDK